MDDERRKFDADFKFRIIEQQAKLEALLTHNNKATDEIKSAQTDHGRKISNLEHALWGGPGIEDVGILEQIRRNAKIWTIIVSVCVFIFSAIGKSVAPLIGKFVTDYIVSSPSEKWRVEQKRHKVRVYKVPARRIEPDSPPLP